MLNENFIGGTDKRNWAWLTEQAHDLAHKFLGYASDEEVAKAAPGTRFYDLDTPGKKGVSNVSEGTRKIIESLPYTSKDSKYKGQSVYSNKKINMNKLTRQELLMDYLRTTHEGFDDAVTQARKFAPYTIRLKEVNPGLYETLKPVVGLRKSASDAARKGLKIGGKLGKFIPGVSTAITGAQAANALKIAKASPTVGNRTWAALRGAEAGLDAVGLAATTTGIGAPIGLAAEMGSLVLGFGTDAAQAIHSKGLKVKNTNLSKQARTAKTADAAATATTVNRGIRGTIGGDAIKTGAKYLF